MRDPELRKRMGQAGRRRALEKFSWQAIAVETKQMYVELIEKNKAFRSSVVTT
jgi:glycosyltransferase involved in cell wall biosynthesis